MNSITQQLLGISLVSYASHDHAKNISLCESSQCSIPLHNSIRLYYIPCIYIWVLPIVIHIKHVQTSALYSRVYILYLLQYLSRLLFKLGLGHLY